MSSTFKFEFIASFECKTLTILTLKCASHGYNRYCPQNHFHVTDYAVSLALKQKFGQLGNDLEN